MAKTRPPSSFLHPILSVYHRLAQQRTDRGGVIKQHARGGVWVEAAGTHGFRQFARAAIAQRVFGAFLDLTGENFHELVGAMLALDLRIGMRQEIFPMKV